jgi:hypothetical protein
MKKAGICLAAVFFVISLLSPVFAAEKNSAGRLGFGVLSGGVPTVKYYLDKNLALEGGLTFASASSNNAAEVLVGLTNDFMAEEKIRWHWGGALVYITAPNTNSFTLQGIFGAEAFIFPTGSISKCNALGIMEARRPKRYGEEISALVKGRERHDNGS